MILDKRTGKIVNETQLIDSLIKENESLFRSLNLLNDLLNDQKREIADLQYKLLVNERFMKQQTDKYCSPVGSGSLIVNEAGK
jgi:hypothetical protein